MNNFKQSLKTNGIGILLMVLASLQTALGQMFWKMSNGEINGTLILGFLLYFLGAIFMIIAFRFGSLSVLHPLLSIGYVFALFLGSMILQEEITESNFLGTLFIIVGAALIGGGDHD
ncbi:EamA family transporter [Halobacillus shinanisalinarum]|uniref:EamA family transporter n=1 Tax=Halobacillus shinanisalinarum TaxID=2932258 RepID=A0ABY4H1X0_9BACI|nr:EamA family transporter [Halobacillus shinanisalinarum]UOQ94436.1 EamA family transporter [Halobacillus shinanisalinarum]